jgi:pyruvate dehydrogenase E2 component (dihydrolipoamide acetyltransferase)
MSIPVIMPKQGQSVETCIITRWFKQPGEKVNTGDLLFSYETDKAAFDHESPAEGTLLEIFFGEGAEVPVLVNVAALGKPGESADSLRPLNGGQSKTEQPVPAEQKHQSLDSASANPADDSRIRISPRAKQLADNNKFNYNNVQGSGPNGRIIISDVQNALSGGAATMKQTYQEGIEFTELPLSNVRKLIAKAMHNSLQNSAQLTHHMSADVRKLLEARNKIKAGLSAGIEKQDITLNDMICFCVIKALKKFPEANSHFLGESIRTFNRVHLGIAVDTPRGLMVPAVKNADDMILAELSRELKIVAEACKKGNVDPELLKGTSASFTVSNLGNYGVEMFTPVINLPQSAILGVCTIIYRPADLGNNTFGFVPYIGLSLTYDHRAIDGGPATLFLKEIKEQIESFSN